MVVDNSDCMYDATKSGVSMVADSFVSSSVADKPGVSMVVDNSGVSSHVGINIKHKIYPTSV